MKHLRPLFAAAAALLLASCGAPAAAPADFDRTVYAPACASGFEILGSHDSGSVLLRVFDPWQGASGFEQRVLLLRDGESAPAGFSGTVVRTPVRRAVCMSSSHTAMMCAVGAADAVAAVSGAQYISDTLIASRCRRGAVADVGVDTAPDFEVLAGVRPDVVLMYGVGDGNDRLVSKLSELGIPHIYIGDYVEQSPLGKAEWLRVAGELTGRTAEADSLFGGIRSRYEALRDSVAAARADAVRPRVMLNTPYRGTWFLPPEGSYMVRLVRDAGGESFCAQGDVNASQAVDIEQAYLLASQADVWLNTGFCTSLDELRAMNPRFAGIAPVRAGRVYNNNARSTEAGGSDFWESGVVRPEVVLRDLITIMCGDGEELYYYRQLR